MKKKGGKKSTWYLGIDPGINPLTVCIKAGQSMFFVQLYTKKEDSSWQNRYHRVRYLSTQLSELILDLSMFVNLEVLVEGYSFGSKGSVYTMAEVKQSILEVLDDTPGLNAVKILPPTSWKKLLLGKGNLNKDEIAIELVKIDRRANYVSKDHNKVDAMAMALLCAKGDR